MNNELVTVKRFFESIQVLLSDVWLESCVSWCKEECLPQNYTLEDVQKQVFEQWLLLDLRDVNEPSLPANLASKKHFVLNGSYCLQMMQLIDISKPKLWQLQKIRNSNVLTRVINSDVDSAGTGKRMLKLTLTDGLQEVDAIEYHPISKLNVNMKPGVKVRIIGPVVVRRGELLLEDKNVKILGGEVEELLISNAAENVLAKMLNLPLNPNPYTIQENLLTIETENKNESSVNRTNLNQYSTSTIASGETQRPTVGLTASNKLQTDFFLQDTDFNTSDFNLSKQIIASTQAVSVQNEKQNVVMASLSDDEDFFDEIDIEAQLDSIEKDMTPLTPCKMSNTNCVSISKVIELKNSGAEGVFKIKAKFKSIVEKLTLDEEYKLIITVTDDSNDLVVRVHSDVVSDFSGYHPAAIGTLKTDISLGNQSATEKVIKALQKVKDKLLALDNIMEIRIAFDEEFPVIMSVIE